MYMETCVQRPQVCLHTVSEHKSACTLLHFFLKLEFAFVYTVKKGVLMSTLINLSLSMRCSAAPWGVS